MLKMRLISDFLDYYDHHFDCDKIDAVFLRKSKSGLNRRQMLKYLDNYAAGFATMFNGKLCPDPWKKVVPHGTVGELFEKYFKDEEARRRFYKDYDFEHFISELVVYSDEDAHRGEGKIRIDINVGENEREEIKKYWNNYASFYLEDYFSSYPRSYRTLCIGEYVFNLAYLSLTDTWRSNVGIVNIVLNNIDVRKPVKNEINYALYALDSVNTTVPNPDDHSAMYRKHFVDFNIAPQVPETVIIPSWGFGDLWHIHTDKKIKGVLENVRKLKGQEVEFKEILPAKEAAESIKKWIEN